MIKVQKMVGTVLRREVEGPSHPFIKEQLLRDRISKGLVSESEVDQARAAVSDFMKSIDLGGNHVNDNEEQLRPYFFKKIFNEALGYSDDQMYFEESTSSDSKKADMILVNPTEDAKFKKKPDVIVEMKDMKIVNLDKKQGRADFTGSPVEQAFSYSTKYERRPNFVIVSNFKEIRIYGSVQGEWSVIYLEDLLQSDYELERFFALLSPAQLLRHSNAQSGRLSDLRSKTTVYDEQISIDFYQTYLETREFLISDIIQSQKREDEPIHYRDAFRAAQKILDRFLFIAFAQDYGFLPEDAFSSAIQIRQEKLDRDPYALWNSLSELFRKIDRGNDNPAINRFNGGLFKRDKNLDTLYVSNEAVLRFADIDNYDFVSDLDVNILGHIFEQAIGDIDKLTDEFSNETTQKLVSKRKKDGIFYTTANVTQYLLSMTISNWIQDQREKLGVDKYKAISPEDIDFFQNEGKTQLSHSITKRVQRQIDNLNMLREKLHNIKILDPAVGSGSFLNAAFDILQRENKAIDKEIRELVGGQTDFWDLRTEILRNNLFGVDINSESVEITKLSLWLKTASSSEPLTTLDDNIKVGNSIINDSSLTDIPFDWAKEFPEIMAEGGFDIVIGNPPYLTSRENKITEEEKQYYNENYPIMSQYQPNLYRVFVEKGYNLLKDSGYFGYIIPNTWMTIETFSRMRTFLLKHTQNLVVINMFDKMFEDAVVDNALLIFKKGAPTYLELGEWRKGIIQSIETYKPDEMLTNTNEILVQLDKSTSKLMKKFNTGVRELASVATVKSGLVAYEVGKGTPSQTKEMTTSRIYHSYELHTGWRKYLQGRDVRRYEIDWTGEYIQYGKNLAAPRSEQQFKGTRILVRQIPMMSNHMVSAALTDGEFINDRNSNNIFDFKYLPEYVLAILNSEALSFWFVNTFNKFSRKTFPQFKKGELEKFPIPKVNETVQASIATKVKVIEKSIESIQNYNVPFNREMKIEFSDWQDVSLTATETVEAQLKAVPVDDRTNLVQILTKYEQLVEHESYAIETAESELDKRIYELYGFTEEEVGLIHQFMDDFIETHLAAKKK
ncbi:Eco57I restriction-modification methylase domain-containing protein [Weissella sp. MSCH1]|uniref:Eco57I restriction-modification methylase domain-containing protein n=1 Tax=Weissella sp. MSCH1 TaxID=3383343 RepID=UPI003896C325